MSYPEAIVAWLGAWARAARFSFAALAAALSFATYDEPTRAVALRQIYFTALQVWAGFTLFTALLSLVIISITVATAREFGLAHYALELVFRVLVLELIPLLTALFVGLRSGAAINTEVAIMQLSGELARMRAADIDPLRRQFVPRVLAAASSVIALTVLAGAVALALAYLVMYGLSPWGFAEYTRTVGHVFTPAALAGFVLKCVAFGVMVAVIPIAAGIETVRYVKPPPVAVMGGMVRLFFALGLIEIAALTVKYV
jgi:phospholipid/cholesterol/gamma-HCH transport system permease protein